MSKEKFPIDAAQIVGLFMESVFYGTLFIKSYSFAEGIFLVTFVNCIRVFCWSEGWFKPARELHWKLLIAALAMFVFATLDVGFHVRHNLDAFVAYGGDPIEEFNKTSSWINVMKMGCYVAQTFIGDAILLYRCWIIYNRRWFVIILPTVLWLACTVCGMFTIYVEATLDTAGDLLNASILVPFITSMLCLTLAMNILTTGLIVYRILKIQRKLKRRNTMVLDSPLSRVAIVMIESGLMYTVSIVVLFGLYMAGNNGQYGVSNAVVQIIGITFNLIITSVDRGDATQPTSSTHHISTRSQNGVPLHLINIQTTVSRYPADADRDVDPEADVVGSPYAARKSLVSESIESPTQALSKKDWRSSKSNNYSRSGGDPRSVWIDDENDLVNGRAFGDKWVSNQR